MQVRFEPQTPAAVYRTGDYWLIPARVASCDILWPPAADGPKPVTAHGVQHHYAPLAIIDQTGTAIAVDCRRIIAPCIAP